MIEFEIYENSVENSSRIFSFKNEKEIHKEFYDILSAYQYKYSITDEQIIEIVSWAELAETDSDFTLDDITIIANECQL